QVRQQGFAVSREQALLGVVGVAAPIRNHSGKVVATIALAAPMIRMDDRRTAEVVELVVQTCQEISERLGYQ
ncbi:MAG: IclR family transcriptional regulator, partial [Chloroflexi bacterium]|nr:IclR family transcriptional regulator [Chloroflexota bacterium]